MWGSLFAGGLGTGMSWWWDNYIDPKNLYYHFAPISAVARIIPLQATNMSPASASVSGVPADLFLSPTQGWGAVSDTALTINSDGSVTSAGAGLGQFLYGSQWNTQLRRPPVFYVNYPASGQFKVRTAGDSGQSPKIVIWVDGVKVLEQNAVVNQTYSVNVSAGQHTIKVDNSGTDWISIASYSFTGLGSGVDVYVLKSDSQNRIAGWALNNSYNHQNVQANGVPAAAYGRHFACTQYVQRSVYRKIFRLPDRRIYFFGTRDCQQRLACAQFARYTLGCGIFGGRPVRGSGGGNTKP